MFGQTRSHTRTTHTMMSETNSRPFLATANNVRHYLFPLNTSKLISCQSSCHRLIVRIHNTELTSRSGIHNRPAIGFDIVLSLGLHTELVLYLF